MKTPILGSSYVARSPNAADSRMVNLYPEIIPEGGKEPAFLSRCPGYVSAFGAATGYPIEGLWELNGVVYFASGLGFYEVTNPTSGSPTVTLLGAIANVTGVSIADNGTQIFIANGSAGYIYNTSTNVFAQITDPDFPGASTVTYLDGFFVFTEPATSKVWVTALLDGTSVDPLDFASAEASPDLVVSVVANNGELWVFGTNTTEVWYNAGGAGFPFAPIQGAYMDVGCTSARSIAKLDKTLYWSGRDYQGDGIVYRANGYTAERVSTHAIEWRIQESASLGTGVAWTYQKDGHAFYVLNFSTMTWVYDVATQAWHERGRYDSGTGEFSRAIGNNCVFVSSVTVATGGVHFVGSDETSVVYVLSSETFVDGASPQKWLRSWRALGMGLNTLKRSAHHSLQLDCETGVGNGNVTLRFSDDGGHTWSNERTITMSVDGEYGRRVIWRRLGMTMKLRDRVYEISSSDDMKVAIMGAELIASATNA